MLFEDTEPLAVISPHLDDGVLSCGDLLSRRPGSTVITVFAGRPKDYSCLTPWDAAAGFKHGEDVIARRRIEDKAALALLGARPCWLNFLDAQYGDSPGVEAIAEALRGAIAATGTKTVVAPLGLFHSDHVLASNAALATARELYWLHWLVYEDAAYRGIAGLVSGRVAALCRDGWRLTSVTPQREPASVKRLALQAYASQLRALSTPGRPGYADAFEPERYYRLERS